MATVKKGVLTRSGQWWDHLRWTKRRFWKGERQAGRLDASREAEEQHPTAGDKAPVRDRP